MPALARRAAGAYPARQRWFFGPLRESGMSSFYPLQSKPFKGAAAFSVIRESHTPSQAAILLSFGNQIRGGDAGLHARAAALNRKGFVASDPEPASALAVPKLKGFDGPVSFDESRARLKRLHTYTTRQRAVPDDQGPLFQSY
jgi:hypothetical protein